ncbi:MAG: response regulator, partial [Chloroflexi bacterium]|nr:response regulator [Chloroflexota bacterium]
AGLLLGRRSMNVFAILCVATISIMFYVEQQEAGVGSAVIKPFFDDLTLIFLTLAMNTILLNVSIRRAEEKTEEIRQTATMLSLVNEQLQTSQIKLEQAQAELEARVIQRTAELRESNKKLQVEIEERQRILDALRQSEENWRSLVEYLPESIATISQAQTITFINRAIGNHDPATLLGEAAITLYGQLQNQTLLEQSMKRVFETGEIVSYESTEITPQGQTWHLNRLGPIKREGEVASLILIATDITEQKLTEAAMYQAQKLESLGVLAGGVAHDFNNLLTAMLIQMSAALAKLPTDHPVVRHIQRTIKATERATELTRQMLNYSGRSPSDTKPLELNDLIMDNIHLFSAAMTKTIQLNSQLSSMIPLVLGDKGQIQQLIMNLILNSADAIGQNPGVITVITDTMELTSESSQYWRWTGTPLPAGRYVKLVVGDTGCGMDEKTLNKIFDPFFTTKFTGRGLGLASLLGIIRIHKGGLHVTSTLGEGTTFTIVLPALAETPRQAQENLDIEHLNLGNEMILVIDDEDMVRDAMSDMLTEYGLNVIQAADGPTGIQLFREHMSEIRVILLDLSMPGMDGEQVFYKLRALSPQVPILLISGYSEHEVLDRFVNKGLAGFIQKPYTIASLLKQMQPHLSSGIQHENEILAVDPFTH